MDIVPGRVDIGSGCQEFPMRRRLWLVAAVALALSLAARAKLACEYCKSSAPNGSSVPYYQCKGCYGHYCGQCEVEKDGLHLCPRCGSPDGYLVGAINGQED